MADLNNNFFFLYGGARVEYGDVTLEAGARALMLYGCANRDDRKFPDAELFNIERRPSDHLGFGMGTHLCAGMHLAKLEITVLLEALLTRVRRFHVQPAERRPHNTLRGIARLETSLEADTTLVPRRLATSPPGSG